MKRVLQIGILLLCVVFASCSKEENYRKYFIGRYAVTATPSISNGQLVFSPSAVFTYTATINPADDGEGLYLAFGGDSVYCTADAEGLHVKKLTTSASYSLNYGNEGARPFECTMSFIEFTMPKPISNGTNASSRFKATTVAEGTVRRSTGTDATYTDIIGATTFIMNMVNDPNVVIERDTSTVIYY